MPWSNQTGGGWKGSNNGGPWGQGPRSNGPNPPDLEELLRRSQDKLKQVLPGGGGSGGFNPVLLLGVLALVVAFVGYNFFTFRVEPDEQGVVLRFGQYSRDAKPGLNLRWPYPIETVYTPQVTRVNRVTIGTSQDDRAGSSTAGRDLPQESLMLTGDENIVDIDFTVFWVINNAGDFLFNIQNPEGTVKAIAESAMREVIGRSDIERVLTEERLSIQTSVQELMQKKLDQYGAGIQITQVQLLNAGPPAEVIDAFRDVQAAEQDQDRIRNEAETYANRVLPGARGQASQIVEAANAYRDQSIAQATGQADRFVKVYESYKAAPDITRQRMYLETLSQVLGGADKVVVDEKTGGVLPYLPLPALKGAPVASQPAQGAAQ
ncbi:FtsH protease activity modulator HflK [Kaistia dalseonensis]|uniref:Protein HflK n=1 Tax=Kaistia dalseonensis TaxID=410840 RepID=A0ABU0HBT5_9HYPH|nr:FtsH protease activity modulator HflK [Kaistia dalseonensis]MCX5497099.1 FtsH protease activity modulator HflK [Kaistia dalseonensis]MDQ0439725.1 membrane protease subunit HflK [Kaistia dalseonensis]